MSAANPKSRESRTRSTSVGARLPTVVAQHDAEWHAHAIRPMCESLPISKKWHAVHATTHTLLTAGGEEPDSIDRKQLIDAIANHGLNPRRTTRQQNVRRKLFLVLQGVYRRGVPEARLPLLRHTSSLVSSPTCSLSRFAIPRCAERRCDLKRYWRIGIISLRATLLLTGQLMDTKLLNGTTSPMTEP
jgi:hypothetical protein